MGKVFNVGLVGILAFVGSRWGRAGCEVINIRRPGWFLLGPVKILILG